MKNLKGLAEMVENCDDEYMKFNLDYDQVLFSDDLTNFIHILMSYDERLAKTLCGFHRLLFFKLRRQKRRRWIF